MSAATTTTSMHDMRSEKDEKRMKKAKAVVVGGSIGGVSCAHALNLAGWDVVVLEKASTPPTRSPTGAGLGLDPLARKVIDSWLAQSDSLLNSTLPLTIDQNQSIDGEKKTIKVLSRDESFNFRAAYWSDLHGALYEALPQNTFMWGCLFLSFTTSSDGLSVKIKAKVIETDEIVEVVGDLLVAADGCLSSIRHSFLPDFKLRYSGYCAWRGVLDLSGNENSETYERLLKAYPELGRCLYFDLGSKTHAVLYELLNKRINWIWYVNQPEPQTKGTSVTMKVSSEMVEDLHQNADQVWLPELARVIKETKEPFVNVIYDSEPLERIVWDNVVLIGDAAHPTMPHGLRSTNMSILDAAVLGNCIEKWGVDKLHSALEEYQSIRLPVIAKQVLHSRQLGRIKQGFSLPDRETFNPKEASLEECQELQQKNMPFFTDVPLDLNS